MAEKMSLVDAAYVVLSNRYAEKNASEPMPFAELLTAVGELLGITDEDRLSAVASKFYTDLTCDGRFVIKEKNTWVLREHELFANIHIDMNAVYVDDEDDDGGESKDDSEGEENDDEDRGSMDDEDAEENEDKDILSSDDDSDND